jgi:hypothetical protein
VFAGGIALAVSSRVQLGRNWGRPMTQKAEPELVTSGPYRFVRHPIYSGLLAALLGTALVTNLIGLIIVAILGAYFYYCASVEEKSVHGRSGPARVTPRPSRTSRIGMTKAGSSGRGGRCGSVRSATSMATTQSSSSTTIDPESPGCAKGTPSPYTNQPRR